MTVTKISFAPISNPGTTVLILGTMPSEKSLEVGEYYGHPRNRFWKIIAAVTNNDLPLTYPAKKQLLLKSNIGLWDVVYQANREGSLDSAIKNETPNDLEPFIAKHPQLKTIGFNGKKAEQLFDKHFTRKPGIKYISLPSSSPANAGISFERICAVWQEIMC